MGWEDNYVWDFTSNGKQGLGLLNRVAINTSYVGKGKLDLWGCFIGRADMFMRDGLLLSGKSAAVFVDDTSGAVDSGMVSITNILGNKHCLN